MPDLQATPVDLSKVTRIEVIDQTGRRYVNTTVSGLELSYQDDGRTLKLFVRDETAQRVLPQDRLTAEEIARLRQSSNDAIAYFRGKLAGERVRAIEPGGDSHEPREVPEE